MIYYNVKSDMNKCKRSWIRKLSRRASRGASIRKRAPLVVRAGPYLLHFRKVFRNPPLVSSREIK